MSTLTSRFLEYRRAPKPPPVAIGPVMRKTYDVEGFLTPEETVLERMGRLVEAIARNEHLSNDNWRFFRMHQGIKCGRWRTKVGARDRAHKLECDTRLERIRRTTCPLIFTGGCS